MSLTKYDCGCVNCGDKCECRGECAYVVRQCHTVEPVPCSRAELWAECSCGWTVCCMKGEEFGYSGHVHSDDCLPQNCPDEPRPRP